MAASLCISVLYHPRFQTHFQGKHPDHKISGRKEPEQKNNGFGIVWPTIFRRFSKHSSIWESFGVVETWQNQWHYAFWLSKQAIWSSKFEFAVRKWQGQFDRWLDVMNLPKKSNGCDRCCGRPSHRCCLISKKPWTALLRPVSLREWRRRPIPPRKGAQTVGEFAAFFWRVYACYACNLIH